jgi:hypothetical protein
MPMFPQTSSSSSCAISELPSSRSSLVARLESGVPLRVIPPDRTSELASAVPP